MEAVNTNKVDLVLNKEQIYKIPVSRKGIYCFRDEFNNPLYVGKSVDLKKRIQQHKTTAKFFFMVEKIEIYFFDEAGNDLLDYYETHFINLIQPTLNKSKAFYKYAFLKKKMIIKIFFEYNS